jgi:hypothetical protein
MVSHTDVRNTSTSLKFDAEYGFIFVIPFRDGFIGSIFFQDHFIQDLIIRTEIFGIHEIFRIDL